MKKSRTSAERPKYNLWQNSAYMVREAWNSRKSVVYFCLLLATLAVATNLAELFIAPVVLKKVESKAPLTELISAIVLFSATLVALSSIQSYISTSTLFGRIEVRINIIQKIQHKVSTTSFPNTEDTVVLKKLEKSNAAVCSNEEATEAIWNTLTNILKNILGFIFYFILLSSLDAVLLSVILLTTVAGYFINKRINEWGYRHREEEAEYSKKMNYICQKEEDISIAKDIRIFGMRTWLEDIYNGTFNLYEAFVARREKVYIWSNVIEILLTLIRNGFAYAYLIYLTVYNHLPASDFLLYFMAVGGFTNWITGILSEFSVLHKQSIDISTVREYLETPEQFNISRGKHLKIEVDTSYTIELRNVSFRYPGAEKDTIKNLNLTIAADEKLAIVGLNGAGKTTLVKLICGFYNPTSGQVLLNGKNICEYNRQDYYRLFSAVFQQFSVLSVSIAENVTQSSEKTDWVKLIKCIEKAGLTEKIKSLPSGYYTNVGREIYEDGIEFSGGEMQKLMLARALYKNSPIFVLDEPTAALDPISENDIYLKYDKMTAGHTCVYISHRLASTRFCDRIIFLDNGNIAEEGTHESLIKQGEKYARLFEIQSKYYKKGADCHE